MSEIFEALRKAQKNSAPTSNEADPDRPAMQLPRAWLDRESTPALAPPVADDVRRPAVRRSGWLARIRSAWASDGRRAPPDVPPDVPLIIQPNTLVAEQFRLLRTRVEMSGPGTVMITSALDNEGKTICAINLAKALSMHIDRGVVLIDADLRHPSTAHSLGLRATPGLVDYLAGDVEWRDCVQSIDEDRLRVIPAGTSSSIAPELLGSPRLPQLIAELKVAFPRQFIVFDAPPLLLTVDPLVLARHVDQVLLIVRAGTTPRAAVIKAIESLGPEHLRGIVFNGATQSGQYYYRDYYYGPPSLNGGARTI